MLLKKVEAEHKKGFDYFSAQRVHEWYRECAEQAHWHPDD